MIYLDHNATTPLDPRVLDAMMPFLTDRFGNAASRHHSLGCDAATATETARQQVASTIGADPREIVWTSGATESDNLALQGVVNSPVYRKRHLITVATEASRSTESAITSDETRNRSSLESVRCCGSSYKLGHKKISGISWRCSPQNCSE